jgi:protein-L-isoaspartate(D-aspartate) O-methyltransferase
MVPSVRAGSIAVVLGGRRGGDDHGDTSVLRNNMVQHQIAARGVSDERVLDAMKVVPREAFMPGELGDFAYEDTPLPIEEGSTRPTP